jgi:hypothetical protein
VDDCTFESDLEIYLSETYVPGSSERMLLYRELDGLKWSMSTPKRPTGLSFKPNESAFSVDFCITAA